MCSDYRHYQSSGITESLPDSSASKFTSSNTSEVEEKVQTDSTETFKGRDVSVERKGMIWKGIGIGLIAGLIMLGIWRKFIVGRSFL